MHFNFARVVLTSCNFFINVAAATGSRQGYDGPIASCLLDILQKGPPDLVMVISLTFCLLASSSLAPYTFLSSSFFLFFIPPFAVCLALPFFSRQLRIAKA